ncbi:MAG: SLBB domain-containing protein [Phycisphaerae bacterium]|nr:SLBB domain-containing protein [Phycisphaerae bacterium]
MTRRICGVTGPALVCVIAAAWLVGCQAVADWTKTDRYRWLSPDKFIEPPDGSPLNPILRSTSLVDQTQELVPNASFPAEGDWEYVEKDYVIGTTDVLIISIMDLFQEGMETPVRREVSDTGYIDLPLLTERIKAEGLTKDELTQAIMRAYSPQIIRNPEVSVIIEARRQSTYYILGAVSRPSQYMIQRRDMRLLEALAIAGGVMQSNIPYIYVIRPAPAIRKAEEALGGGEPGALPETLPTAPEELLPEPLPEPLPQRLPGERALPTEPGPVESGPSPVAPVEEPLLRPRIAPETQPPSPERIERATRAVESNDIEAALRELGEGAPPATSPAPPGESPSPSVLPHLAALNVDEGPADAASAILPRTKWMYRDGTWVRAPKQEPPAPEKPGVVLELSPTQPGAETTPPVETTPPARPLEAIGRRTGPATAEAAKGEDPFGWRKASKSDMARIIAVNLQKLNDGDPRQNIVIRDNDIIHVPYLPVGEFYVTGEVLRPGVYSLPSTPVTVKQALSAAGNVGPFAWPENSVLIRRIGTNQEQIIPINVEAVFRGQEPDLFLKPNDVIAVGTDVRAPFFAVVRNAFRMTYGFGFIYDRNFSDPLLPGYTPKSNRFTRW